MPQLRTSTHLLRRGLSKAGPLLSLTVQICLLKICKKARSCSFFVFILSIIFSFQWFSWSWLFTVIPEDKDHFRSGRGWTRAVSLEQAPKVRPLIRKHFTNEGISLMHENTPAAAVLSSNQGFLSYKETANASPGAGNWAPHHPSFAGCFRMIRACTFPLTKEAERRWFHRWMRHDLKALLVSTQHFECSVPMEKLPLQHQGACDCWMAGKGSGDCGGCENLKNCYTMARVCAETK